MRKLLVDPDPRLRKICQPIDTIDRYVKNLVKEMQKYVGKEITVGGQKHKLVGLAAPQLGELVRVFVVNTGNFSIVMINPEVVKEGKMHQVVECCESIPNKVFLVERPKWLKLRGLNLEGNRRSVKAHDFLAQLLMHEAHHLQGILVDDIAIKRLDE